MTGEQRDDATTPYLTSRRIVFHGLGALGVAAALAGCGAGGSGADSSTGGTSASAGATKSKSGTVLTKTSEVPQNGGVILTDAKIVVTQPTAGTYKAFTATCTHQGFLVTSVDGGTISCDHHGSEFSATDGSVKRGPASASLTPVDVVVQGANVVTA